MTDPPDPLGHLLAARADLLQQLVQVQQEIRAAQDHQHGLAQALFQLEGVIKKLGGNVRPDAGPDFVVTGPDGVQAVVELKRTIEPGSGPPNVREAILQLLDREDRAWEAAEVVDGVRDMGVDAQPASIRSLLSKMAEGGQIDRPKRGLYQRKGALLDPAAGSGGLIRPSGRFVRQAEIPTPAEFMAMRTDPDEEEPDFDPSDYDPDEHDEPEPDRSDADYREMYREERLEDEADRGEPSS